MNNDWGPFHRHFASNAIHRDGGPECDQPGSPRPVYVFDPDYLDEHDEAVRADERERIAQAIGVMRNRWLDNFDKGVVGTGPANVLAAFDRSARIARDGGRDD